MMMKHSALLHLVFLLVLVLLVDGAEQQTIAQFLRYDDTTTTTDKTTKKTTTIEDYNNEQDNSEITTKTKTESTKVIAIGDSITAGDCSSNGETHSWPAQLQDMVTNKNGIEIINYGVSGRTAMKSGDFPYWNEQAFVDAKNSQPNIVIIMLGTNDAKTYQWNETAFKHDYTELITIFKNLDTKPDVYVMIPPPLYEPNAYEMNQTIINEIFPLYLIRNIAKNAGLDPINNVIDIYNAMGGKQLTQWELFCNDQNCDPCHPNDSGYTYMASNIYQQLFGKPMPPVTTTTTNVKHKSYYESLSVAPDGTFVQK